MIEGLNSIARQRAEETVSTLLVENALNNSEIASAFLKDEACCNGDPSQLDNIIAKIPEDSDDECRINMVLNADSDVSAGDLLAAGVTQESADDKKSDDNDDDKDKKEDPKDEDDDDEAKSDSKKSKDKDSDDEDESKEEDDEAVSEFAKDFFDLFGDD